MVNWGLAASRTVAPALAVGPKPLSPCAAIDWQDYTSAQWADVQACMLGAMAGAAQTDTVSYLTAVSGSLKWYGGILAPNGKVYFVPYNMRSVLVVDPADDSLTMFGVTGWTATGSAWIGGALMPNGRIYCPCLRTSDMTQWLEIDTNNDTATVMTATNGGYGLSGAAPSPQGHVYSGSYFDRRAVVKLDPAADTSQVLYDPSAPGTGGNWTSCVLAPNGCIYFCPGSSSNPYCLKLDPSTDARTYIPLDTSLGAGTVFGGIHLASNGHLYLVAAAGSYWQRVDWHTDTASQLSGTYMAYNWQDVVLSPNGCFYGCPGNAVSILKLDTADDTVSYPVAVVGGGAKWFGGACTPDGKVYMAPTNQPTVLKLDTTDRSWSEGAALHPYINTSR